MSDNIQGTGGSWAGFMITGILGIIAQITLSDVALICTCLAGLTTTGYTINKWRKGK